MTRRSALKVALAVALPLLVLLSAAGWLLGTEAGLRFAYDRVRGAGLPLTIEQMSGTLAGDLALSGVAWGGPDGPAVAIDRLNLNWAPLALLTAQLRFQRLHADGVRVVVPPGPEQPAPDDDGDLPLPPVGVAVTDGLLEDLVVHTPDFSFRLDRGVLSARYRGGRIRIARLELDGPGYAVAVEGRVGLRPESRVRLETRWRLEMEGRRYAGGGSIGGRLSALELDQRLTVPVELALGGTLRWLDQPLQWQARLQAEPFELQQLHPALPSWRAAGSVAGEGGTEALTAQAELSLQGEAFGRWAVTGEVVREQSLWRVPGLTATSGERRLALQGDWRGAAQQGKAELTWRNLAWPLTGDPAVQSAQGRLLLAGSPDDYRYELESRVGTPALPPVTGEGNGTGTLEGLTVDRLEGEWLDGHWRADGAVNWRDGVAWQAGLVVEGLDPADVAREWPGAVDGRLVSRGRLDAAGLRLDAMLEHIDGTLRGRPIAGNGAVTVADGSITVGRSRLEYGDAFLTARGSLTQRWDFAWTLRAPQLAGLVPGAAGRVSGEGAISGPRAAPVMEAHVSGSALAFQGLRIADLSAELSGPADQERWSATLALEQVRWGALTAQSLRAEGGGTAGAHQLTVTARDGGWRFSQQLAGALVADGWRGTLRNGRLATSTGPWQQQAPAALGWLAGVPELQPFCWNGPEAGQLCAEAESAGSPPGTVLRLQMQRLPLALLEPWLPRRDLVLEGAVDGRAQVQLADGVAGFDFSLQAGPGSLALPAPGAEPLSAAFRTFRLEGQGGVEGAAVEARIDLVEQGAASATARLPRWRPGDPFDAAQPLGGSAEIALDDLEWISLLVPQLVAPRGQIDGRLVLGGTLGAPTLDGAVRLHEASATLPALGISLEQLSLRLRPAPGALLAIDGSARSGSGTVSVDGVVSNPAGEPWQLQLQVTGEQFLAVQLPQYRIVASPDLQVRVRLGTVALTGQVRVPAAQVNLPEIPTVAQPSPDVVVLGEEQRDPNWIIRSEVEVVFGDAVRVQGYGFSGRIDGWIRVIEQAAGIATAQGTLNIRDGRYEAYGQRFVIDQGRLLYAQTPLDNPGINFRAVREIEDITVGISVTGRLQQPTVRLFSEPSMEESDILSYLVLGRPLQSASEQEAFDLAQAATSLGLVGGGRVAERIGAEFGFDVVKLESATGNDEAALVLGKFLSPRLYIQYAVGLWEAVNTFRIRYDLGGGWVLEAQEGGTESSTDLLYSIER